MDKPYKSFARWPKGTFDGQNNYTEDGHDSLEAAAAVCRMLQNNGAGGDRKEFPVEVGVILEPIVRSRAMPPQAHIDDALIPKAAEVECSVPGLRLRRCGKYRTGSTAR